MSIKLIAIDIDGTLINSDHQLTNEVHAAIQEAKKQGIRVVLCTGRPVIGLQKLLTELDLFSDEDFAISFNGSLVQKTKSNEIISQFGLTHEDYLDIELLARKINVHMHAETDEAIYTANRDISPYTIHEVKLTDMPLKYRTQEEMTADYSIIKMMMIDEPAILDAAIAKIPQSFYDKYTISKSTPFFLEFMNKQVDKGAALGRLADYLGLDVSEVMAIGDNENDLTMIRYAGLGVAMGNAVDSVKEAADVITLTNDEHGVAAAIKKYALK